MTSQPLTREALCGRVDDYLAALVARDPSRLPWAEDARYTDNNVELAVGDGAWSTVDGLRGYDLKFADPETGQAAWFGVIEEHGHPAIMALRLRIDGDGRIAEAEQIVTRKVENSPFPSIDTYVEPRPIMLADVPEARRVPRARMIELADGYFDTLQLNDGTIRTVFAEDCERIENGLQTTHNDSFPNYPIAAFGCEAQFRLGQFRYDDRLRARRFPLVDEAKGVVLAGGFIDHRGKLVDFAWTDGTPVKSFFHFPHSYCLLEAFKIVDGAIAAVEAIFIDVPYHMPSPWERP